MKKLLIWTLIGVALMTIGCYVKPLFFLAWIGGPITLIALYKSYRLHEKRERKLVEGEECGKMN